MISTCIILFDLHDLHILPFPIAIADVRFANPCRAHCLLLPLLLSTTTRQVAQFLQLNGFLDNATLC